MERALLVVADIEFVQLYQPLESFIMRTSLIWMNKSLFIVKSMFITLQISD